MTRIDTGAVAAGEEALAGSSARMPSGYFVARPNYQQDAAAMAKADSRFPILATIQEKVRNVLGL